jgi:tetratricopeptide (TPR) repeat protein
MKSIRDRALLHLTGQSTLQTVPIDQLESLIQTYPYFAPATLLYHAKCETEGIVLNDEKTSGKSLLFTDNPLWTSYLLQASIATEEVGMPETPVNDKTTVHSTKTIDIPTMDDVRDIIKSIDPRKVPDNPPEVDETEEEYEEPVDELPLPDAKLSDLLSEQLADFKKPIDAAAQLEIETERLHTIDYFASQGIKIDLSKIPQDKLTSQLRKFTDWLKQMKQVNNESSDLGTGSDLEQAVALIAENSNESREVVTETMAEVLEKQGQLDKAIQLYIKLSFINPEKSAYFAAKIQQLKGI